jgi:hypothetical protein
VACIDMQCPGITKIHTIFTTTLTLRATGVTNYDRVLVI